jgi:hypothetical protein
MSNKIDTFLMTDQPETCRQCGRRTRWVQLGKSLQMHICEGCQYGYLLEEEPDDITEQEGGES